MNAFSPTSRSSQTPDTTQSPPEEPPPSYDDATHSASSPLLVGPPPGYGTTHQAYPEPDGSSTASSDLEETSRALPEWVGQGLVVLCFLAILYGFYKLVNDSDGFGS